MIIDPPCSYEYGGLFVIFLHNAGKEEMNIEQV